MDIYHSITVFIIFALVLLLTHYWYRRPKKFPPGPRGLPLVGVIPFCVNICPEVAFKRWSRIFGNVMSVRLGRDDHVVLNDYETIQMTLAKSEFSGRPLMPFFERFTKGLGFVFLDGGETYQAQRKFGLLTLRQMGVGKKSMENRIAEEASYLNEALRQQEGKPFSASHFLKRSVSNNICSVVFGSRFEYEDPMFKDLIYRMNMGINNPRNAILTRLLIFAPVLIDLQPFSTMYNRNVKFHLETAVGHYRNIVEDHKNTFDENNIRDFIDAFILEMKQKTHSSFTVEQLCHFVRDLFIAGTETSTSTLRWGLLCMLHFPETQKKLHQEIMDVLGSSGNVTMSHRADMPYTCAFIQELFRFRTVAPLSIMRKATTNIELEGYFIPKGTKIVPNIWAVHNDPDLWKEPDKFRPERHLSKAGNFLNSPHVIPFSVGSRRCLGEPLARMIVFVFLVSLVQKFEFLPNPSDKNLPPIDDGMKGLSYSPYAFKLVAKER